ncbi:MAG TPA: DUF3152 domain-containing protein [Jatrophihabitans sp.]
MQRHGWRAYALPVLVVITVLALFTTTSPHTVRRVLGQGDAKTTAPGGPPNAASNQQLKSDDPGAGALNSVLPALQLPPGPKYTTAGTGAFATIPGSSKPFGNPHGQLRRFSIEVESGVTGVDLKQFASIVMTTLQDKRSWIRSGQWQLQRVDSGAVDFHIGLTSSMTVRTLCGYDQPVETSCFTAANGNRVVLNVARWVRGAKAYLSDLATYRVYAVNHEVGHALQHNHSHECLANGMAPVMMQQTIGTKMAGGKICQPNPWPYPVGAKDAPGPEEPGGDADLQFFNLNSH